MLQPFFHMQLSPFINFNSKTACYTRPIQGGLFHLQVYDPLSTFTSQTKTALTIEGCEFRNFFYEMDSLVALPLYQPASQPLPFSLTLTNSTFQRFSGCGSILSNQNSLEQFTDYPLTARTDWRSYEPTYQQYTQHLKRAFMKYMLLRYYSRAPAQVFDKYVSSVQRYQQGAYQREIVIKQNTFTELNYLKKSHLENEPTRLLNQFPRVANESMRDQGFAINLGEYTIFTYLWIEGNTFKDTSMAYSCIQDINEPQNKEHNQNVLTDSSNDQFIQMHHIIRSQYTLRSLVIINNNEFRNLSTAGSIIHLEDAYDSGYTPFIIARNSFKTIHSYINANAISIIREDGSDKNQPLPDADESYQGYNWSITSAYYYQCVKGGGQIVFLQNNFNDMCGCPQVDTGAVLIGMRDSRGGTDGAISWSRGIPDQTTQYDLYSQFNQDGYKLQSQIFLDRRIEHPTIGSISLNKMSTNFTGNIYANISMGVKRIEIANSFVPRGCLISLRNLEGVDFYNDTFENIGGFTVNKSNDILNRIKNVKDSSLSYTPDALREPWYTQNRSSGLIAINGLLNFAAFGNIFKNIWLIDRVGAISLEQQQGIILILDLFYGQIYIGKDGYPPNKILNCQGFLTDQNLREGYFPYSVNASANYSDLVQYGAGSPLFAITSTFYDIRFFLVIISNTVIENCYFSSNGPLGYKSYTRTSAIITLKTGSNMQTFSRRVILSKLAIKSTTFDGAFYYFELKGDGMDINNLYVEGLGQQKYPGNAQNPLIRQIIDKERPRKGNSYAFIKIYQNNAWDEIFQIQYLPSKISDSLFKNLHSMSGGLPLIEYGLAFNTHPEVETRSLLYNITIADYTEYDMNNLDVSQVPLSSFIRVAQDQFVNLNFEIRDIHIIGAMAQNGLFDVSSNIPGIVVSNSSFVGMRGITASVLWINQDKIESLYFQEITFVGNRLSSYQDLDIVQSFKDDAKEFTQPSMLVFDTMSSVSIVNSTVSGQHFAKQAAFMEINRNTAVIMTNTIFSDMSAYQAGALSVNGNSNLYVKNCSFKDHKAIDQGVFSVNLYSTIKIETSTFQGNQAIQNGVFKFTGESYFQISRSTFSKNRAELKNSIGSIIQLGKESNITDCIISENKAYLSGGQSSEHFGRLLESVSNFAPFAIISTQFFDNEAIQGTSNLYFFDVKNALIENCDFSNKDLPVKNQPTKKLGDFVQIISNSQINIQDSQFTNGYAANGGAIYIQGEATIDIKRTKFVLNNAYKSGGAIFADSFLSLKLSDNIVFTNNYAYFGEGDSLYLYNSFLGRLILSSVTFISRSFESNFIFARDLKMLSMEDIQASIDLFTKPSFSKAAGIFLINVYSLNIQRSRFINIQGTKNGRQGGGAMIIQYLEDAQIDDIVMNDCIFENSHSSNNGGALSLIDVRSMTISNSIFKNNKASLNGGAIAFSCNSTLILLYPCNLDLKNTKFKDNHAGFEGGAIKWNYYEPTFNQVTFENNSAKEYGDDIASIAKYFVRIEKSQIGQKAYEETRKLEVTQEIQSGGSISLYFGLIDKYSNFIRTDNKSKLFAYVSKLENTNTFTPVIESETQFVAKYGVFSIENLLFVSEPNSTQSNSLKSLLKYLALNFITDGINSEIPDNEMAFETGQANLNFPLRVKVRGCVLGEQMLSNGKCKQCEAGSYLLEPSKKPQQCKNCKNEVSVCKGGATIYPREGYWRSSNLTDNFFQCLNHEACLGFVEESEIASLGLCADGYKGILCASCKTGYTLSEGSRKCLKCPSKTSNTLQLAAFIIVIVIFVIILVRSNLKSSVKIKNYLPVYLRILVNHLQLVALVGSFDFNWPEQFVTFFKGLQPLSDAQAQILAVDCFLEQDEQSDGKRPYYYKTIVLFVLPIVLILVSFAAWMLISVASSIWITIVRSNLPNQINNPEAYQGDLGSDNENAKSIINELKTPQSENSRSKDYKEEKQGIIGNAISTIIVILFLIHPTVTRGMFNMFKQDIIAIIINSCKNIEGVSRLFVDLDVICYNGVHYQMAFSLALPAIIIYSTGIPIIGLIVIFKNRMRLQRAFVKQRYGFLYNGYKKGFASYWEIFVIYRKVAIIFIQVFLVQNGKVVQALVTLIFLILLMFLVKTFEPYNKYCLNQLEFLSLFTSAASVYFCIFFITDTLDPSQLSNNLPPPSFFFYSLLTRHREANDVCNDHAPPGLLLALLALLVRIGVQGHHPLKIPSRVCIGVRVLPRAQVSD
ncbi:hypothetical protein FGO68_gene9839 [Halteria grandinella]|uniref:Transmembrane protein n=1 Tax=Halteria grandinella TaxID=5974 RepID=A0A8J8NHV1_HALGN|nr:hypothetical protein FGO68_gene9839 [Halteria grandinella]